MSKQKLKLGLAKISLSDVALIFVLALYSTAAAAQHGGHHPQMGISEQERGAMMGGGMKSAHQELQKLFVKVEESLASLRSEKDPGTLRTKLDAHARVLQQFQDAWKKQSDMMGEHMKMCPTMDSKH